MLEVAGLSWRLQEREQRD